MAFRILFDLLRLLYEIGKTLFFMELFLWLIFSPSLLFIIVFLKISKNTTLSSLPAIEFYTSVFSAIFIKFVYSFYGIFYLLLYIFIAGFGVVSFYAPLLLIFRIIEPPRNFCPVIESIYTLTILFFLLPLAIDKLTTLYAKFIILKDNLKLIKIIYLLISVTVIIILFILTDKGIFINYPPLKFAEELIIVLFKIIVFLGFLYLIAWFIPKETIFAIQDIFFSDLSPRDKVSIHTTIFINGIIILLILITSYQQISEYLNKFAM